MADIRPGQSVEGFLDPEKFVLSEVVERAKAAIARSHPVVTELTDFLRHELERSDGGRAPWIRKCLELLSALGCDFHILSLKTSLQAHPDPFIRSKATLMVGRASKNLAWISRSLMDPDARVQANAIESLWGSRTKEWRQFLESALKSPHHRVMANALVGYYMMEDLSSIPKLMEMAGHPDENFRLAARWAMGATDDPRFLPFLTHAFEKDQGRCRTMDVRSLTRLRRKLAAFEHAGRLKLAVWQAGIGEGGSRQIGLSVLRGSSEEAFALAPTAVVIVENSKLISEYSVTALPQPDRLAIGIVIPRILSRADEYRMATEAGLNKCLEVKPSGDLWVLDRYHCGEQTETETEPSVSMNDPAEDPILLKHLRLNRGFLREPEIIAKLIPGPGHRDKTSADLEASMEKVMSTVARASAARHVIVCLDPEDEFKESRVEGLVRAAKDDGFSIDGVAADSVRGAETFRQVCDATGGVLRLVPAAQVAEALPELYQSLRNRFQICYQNADAPENRKVDIDIYTPQGSGKLHLELPEKG